MNSLLCKSRLSTNVASTEICSKDLSVRFELGKIIQVVVLIILKHKERKILGQVGLLQKLDGETETEVQGWVGV